MTPMLPQTPYPACGLRPRFAALAAMLCALCCCGPLPAAAASPEAPLPPPRLRPALDGVTIPPNLCPLTCVVDEPGTRYALRLETAGGSAYETGGKDPALRPAAKPWQRLLQEASGGDLVLRVRARGSDGTWRAFAPVVVHVSGDPVDPYLVYRRIRPLYNYWRDVGVYQRDLAGWDEDVVIHGRDFANGCTNCHAFPRADPATLSLGIRSQQHGSATLVYRHGQVQKLDTKWGYTAWHPSGKVAAYSLNKVRQFFHATGDEVRDVCDLDSDLAVHDVEGDRAVSAPAIADPGYLETYPAWSADGRELYFCRAPITWDDREQVPPPGYGALRYSLVKVSFDVGRGQFGTPQVVLSAEETGKSVMLPRPSPDGRFVLFCLCDYGCFPIYQPSSDLGLLDLATGKHRLLDLNSDQSESWHSWSSNGRWIAFSSKRGSGVFTRVYLAHVDADGTVGKPFVLPQADPTYYDRCLQTLSLPEFATARVPVSPRTLAAAVRRPGTVRVELPAMSMTAAPARPPPPSAEGLPPEPH